MSARFSGWERGYFPGTKRGEPNRRHPAHGCEETAMARQGLVGSVLFLTAALLAGCQSAPPRPVPPKTAMNPKMGAPLGKSNATAQVKPATPGVPTPVPSPTPTPAEFTSSSNSRTTHNAVPMLPDGPSIQTPPSAIVPTSGPTPPGNPAALVPNAPNTPATPPPLPPNFGSSCRRPTPVSRSPHFRRQCRSNRSVDAPSDSRCPLTRSVREGRLADAAG